MDILSGHFKVFDSINPNDIRAEALMASACIPTLFKAVEIDGAAYWDGLFSQNPPVAKFLRLDREHRPDEIWVIMINPLESKTIPQTAQDIIDRRNELSGNLSLYLEIRFIELINRWIANDVFKPELMEKVKPVQVRWIKMSERERGVKPLLLIKMTWPIQTQELHAEGKRSDIDTRIGSRYNQ